MDDLKALAEALTQEQWEELAAHRYIKEARESHKEADDDADDATIADTAGYIATQGQYEDPAIVKKIEEILNIS
jgi:signal recognition particle GTPase